MAKPIQVSDGWRWFKDALLALKNQPLGLVGIVIFYILISGLLSGIPVIGPILAGVWMPFGAVLTGFATRDALRRRLPTYAPLLAAARKQVTRLHLISVGLVSAGCMEIIFLVAQWLSADKIKAWKMTDEGIIDTATIMTNFPWLGVCVGLALYTPLFMATLFAPLLIADAGQTPGKSFFYSFFGTARNFVPCLLAGVLLVGLTAVIAFIGNGLFLALGLGNAFSYLSPFVVIFMTSIAQAMVWPMYRDLFGEKALFDRLP